MTTDQTIESLKLAMAKLCQCYADGYEDCANCPFEGYQSCPLQAWIDYLGGYENRFKNLWETIDKYLKEISELKTERDVLNDFIMGLDLFRLDPKIEVRKYDDDWTIEKEIHPMKAIDLIREVGKLEDDA